MPPHGQRASGAPPRLLDGDRPRSGSEVLTHAVPADVPVDLGSIQQRLSARSHLPVEDATDRRAAVATILRGRGSETEVLLIRRAEKIGDPWSGHMAFPGGHHEPTDPDLLATALRETHEEIGMDLGSHGQLLGRLDDLQARARGRSIDMVVSPFVFALEVAEPQLRLNGEVAEVVWAPLGAMARGELDTFKGYRWEDQQVQLPAYRVGSHVVWGMTYVMLRSLLYALGRP